MTRKPHWWDKANEISWNDVKSTLLEGWHSVKSEAKQAGQELQETALALGHGARSRFPKAVTWTKETEAELKRDWEAMHKEAESSWEQVKDAVQHGWERGQR